MNRHALSHWARPMATFACSALVVMVLRAWLLDAPTQDDEWLVSLAIFIALPWSLGMMLMDLSSGFGSRAGWLLAIGIGINLAIAVWIVVRIGRWVQRLRLRSRHRP